MRVAVVSALVLVQACGAGWHRVNPVTPQSARQQVEVWQGDTAQQWHAVHVTHDSISGVPYHLPTTCDSCRRTVSRATVDSVRFGDPVGGFWRTYIVVVVIPGLISLWLLRGMGGT